MGVFPVRGDLRHYFRRSTLPPRVSSYRLQVLSVHEAQIQASVLWFEFRFPNGKGKILDYNPTDKEVGPSIKYKQENNSILNGTSFSEDSCLTLVY